VVFYLLSMEVLKEENEEKGVYFIEVDGIKVAQMIYVVGPQRKIIQHTEVGSEFRGQGISKLLIEKAIEEARLENYNIVPMCQVARKYFESHPESKDVL